MNCFTSAFAAFLVAACAATAAGQSTDTSRPAPTPDPRVELGGGITVGIVTIDGLAALAMPDVRGSVALDPRWAVEGVFDIIPPEEPGWRILYRAQVRWQTNSDDLPGGSRMHLTFGAAGWIAHYSTPEYRWQDASGQAHVYPARTYWSAIPPVYPTVGVGLRETMGAHFALRADLAAIIVPTDGGVAVLLMPSVSVSIPIGR